jgi:hypothetical protein
MEPLPRFRELQARWYPSSEELSRVCGVHRSVIYKCRLGQVPGAASLAMIAEALGVAGEELEASIVAERAWRLGYALVPLAPFVPPRADAQP